MAEPPSSPDPEIRRRRKRGRHGAPAPSAARATPPPPITPAAPAAATEPTAAPATEPAAAATDPIAAAPEARGPRPTRELPAHLPPPRESRSEARNAEIRATLRPYAPGERPRVVLASAGLSAALALANFISWLAGLKISGQHPGAAGILIFTAILMACAVGLWQMRSGAVLGFMCLMAIIAILFTLFLIEASNILGAVVALAIIIVTGYLFFKLVRVLSRLQMPREG